MPEERNQTITLSDGTVVELNVGKAVVNGVSADRMDARDPMGLERSHVIFEHDGNLTIATVNQVLNLRASSLAGGPVSGNAEEALDQNPLPEEQGERLLALYRKFEHRTYR